MIANPVLHTLSMAKYKIIPPIVSFGSLRFGVSFVTVAFPDALYLKMRPAKGGSNAVLMNGKKALTKTFGDEREVHKVEFLKPRSKKKKKF